MTFEYNGFGAGPHAPEPSRPIPVRRGYYSAVRAECSACHETPIGIEDSEGIARFLIPDASHILGNGDEVSAIGADLKALQFSLIRHLQLFQELACF